MKTIWKFPASTAIDNFTLMMPSDHQTLCAQLQNGEVQIWAIVAPDSETVPTDFRWHLTGHHFTPRPEGEKYISTVQLAPIVFHLFEVNLV